MPPFSRAPDVALPPRGDFSSIDTFEILTPAHQFDQLLFDGSSWMPVADASLDNRRVHPWISQVDLMQTMLVAPDLSSPGQTSGIKNIDETPGSFEFSANGVNGHPFIPTCFSSPEQVPSQSSGGYQSSSYQELPLACDGAIIKPYKCGHSQIAHKRGDVSIKSQPDANGRFWCLWPGCEDTKGFSRDTSLWRHIKAKHLYSEAFTCSRCGKKFDRADSLRTHQRTTGHNYNYLG